MDVEDIKPPPNWRAIVSSYEEYISNMETARSEAEKETDGRKRNKLLRVIDANKQSAVTLLDKFTNPFSKDLKSTRKPPRTDDPGKFPRESNDDILTVAKAPKWVSIEGIDYKGERPQGQGPGETIIAQRFGGEVMGNQTSFDIGVTTSRGPIKIEAKGMEQGDEIQAAKDSRPAANRIIKSILNLADSWRDWAANEDPQMLGRFEEWIDDVEDAALGGELGAQLLLQIKEFSKTVYAAGGPNPKIFLDALDNIRPSEMLSTADFVIVHRPGEMMIVPRAELDQRFEFKRITKGAIKLKVVDA